MGLIQTETPYFQPDPTALSPYTIGAFSSDPVFDDCGEAYCIEAWALRVLNSTNVFIYGAGLYSFFSDFSTDCNVEEKCQERIIETSFTQGLWMYNLATKGAVQVVSPAG
jgi:glucan 1,3-beta-glucosidase